MITSGIDIGKNSHVISVIDQDTGVLLVKPTSFTNNFEGFKKLDKILRDIRKKVTYTNLSSAIYEFLNSTSILI